MRRLIGSLSIVLFAVLALLAPAVADPSSRHESAVTALSASPPIAVAEVADLTLALAIEQAEFRTPGSPSSASSPLDPTLRVELRQTKGSLRATHDLRRWRPPSYVASNAIEPGFRRLT